MNALGAQSIFEQLAGGPLPEWPMVAAAARVRSLAAGETLFSVGQALAGVFVVTRGVVKMVYDTPTGDAWVKAFALPGTCFTSVAALATGGVSSFSARAVNAAVIEQIDYALLQSLAARHLAWQRALSNAFQIYGARKEKREMELLTLSAQQRYENFMQEYAGLERVLTQKDIASYVRVTPVALSRIKARIQRAKSAAPSKR